MNAARSRGEKIYLMAVGINKENAANVSNEQQLEAPQRNKGVKRKIANDFEQPGFQQTSCFKNSIPTISNEYKVRQWLSDLTQLQPLQSPIGLKAGGQAEESIIELQEGGQADEPLGLPEGSQADEPLGLQEGGQAEEPPIGLKAGSRLMRPSLRCRRGARLKSPSSSYRRGARLKTLSSG